MVWTFVLSLDASDACEKVGTFEHKPEQGEDSTSSQKYAHENDSQHRPLYSPLPLALL